MRQPLKFCAVLALIVILRAAPTADDFARSPTIVSVRISPDGKNIALVSRHDGKVDIVVADFDGKNQRRIDTQKIWDHQTGLNWDLTTARPIRQVKAVRWITDRRLLLSAREGSLRVSGPAFGPVMNGITLTYSGEFVMDNDGKNVVCLANPLLDPMASDLRGGLRSQLIWEVKSERFPAAANEMIVHGQIFRERGLFKINTGNAEWQQIARAPDSATDWILDHGATARFAITRSPSSARLAERKLKSWTPFVDFGAGSERWRFHGLDPTEQKLYISKPAGGGRWALFAFDLKEKTWDAPVLQHEHFDVLPDYASPQYAGIELSAPVFSQASGELLGVRLVEDAPRVHWFSSHRAEIQRKLDATRRGHINLIADSDAREEKFIVLSWSARDPGEYLLLDVPENRLVSLGRIMRWLAPDELGEMFPVKIPARDGQELHGYLTVRPGAEPRKRPLVLLLHDAAWTRDYLTFSPLGQFLATRGYAVLQVNYRGSSGYGAGFAKQGRADPLGVVPNDLEDAVRWAVQTGLADSKNVAVMGTGFGGYLALCALGHRPATFACGVAISAVIDWTDLARKSFRTHWSDEADVLRGETSPQRLREISPPTFADQISAPLLIAHHEPVRFAPADAARTLVSAMKKAGRPPETYFFDSPDENEPDERSRATLYRRIEAFLGRHLQPSNPPSQPQSAMGDSKS